MTNGLWFAPRVSGRFTRRWFEPIEGGVRFYGPLFWLVLWLWLALKLLQVALWLAVLLCIWLAQLPCLLVMAIRAAYHPRAGHL